MRRTAARKRGGPDLERIEAVQQRLHALHAAMRVRLVQAEEANTGALESLGRELRASASEMTLDEQLNVRTEISQMRDRQMAMVSLMARIAEFQQLIEIMRLFGNLTWEEDDGKLFHLRKILLLLVTIYLFPQILIFQESQAEELRRIRTKLPGWF